MRNIFLTGFMGCGKSRVARGLSAMYGVNCLETDHLVEEAAGCTICEIFAKYGEVWFRDCERRVLHDIPDYAIVSTGGGLPCYADNMSWMKSQGTVFYLQSQPDLLARRLERPSSRARRPLLPGDADLEPFVRETLRRREPFYLEADYILDASCDSIQQLVRQIYDIIERPADAEQAPLKPCTT